MSFLKRMLGGFTSRKLSDPVFEDLRFFDFGDPAKDDWEGTASAEEGDIEVFIDAGPEGPSQRQRDFYLTLISDQDTPFERCKALLIPAWEEWPRRGLAPDWRSAITLSSRSMPGDGEDEGRWEVCYKPKSGDRLLVSLVFERGMAESFPIEG